MDRLAYIAMGSAADDEVMQSALANNLANVNTTGYKKDQVSFKSLYVNGGSAPVRVYGKVGANGVDLSAGPLKDTAQPLDIAMNGNAWLSVTNSKGETGYVHTASLHVNSSGILVTQNGDTVNSPNGFTITVPPGGDVSIDKSGGVNVIKNGQLSVVDKLKIVALPKQYVSKNQSGLIQVDPAHASDLQPVQGNVVTSGVLEGSNVSPIDSLVRMMDLARQYEANVTEISTAKKIDSAANQLLTVR